MLVDSWPSFKFYFFDSTALDITDEQNTVAILEKISPMAIINCAAYTAVDKAEIEKKQAYTVNTEGVKVLSRLAKEQGFLLIHYSSDYVYNNGSKAPMKESDPTTPDSIYAKSKLDGDIAIMNSGCQAIILRTSWVYSDFGNNFITTMLKLGKEKSHLNIVDDQIGAPTYTDDIVNATMKILSTIMSKEYTVKGGNIFNYSGQGTISWYDFATYIFEYMEIDISTAPIPSIEYKTPATRPKWSVMDMTKIKKTFGIAPVYWKESIKIMLSKDLNIKT